MVKEPKQVTWTTRWLQKALAVLLWHGGWKWRWQTWCYRVPRVCRGKSIHSWGRVDSAFLILKLNICFSFCIHLNFKLICRYVKTGHCSIVYINHNLRCIDLHKYFASIVEGLEGYVDDNHIHLIFKFDSGCRSLVIWFAHNIMLTKFK